MTPKPKFTFIDLFAGIGGFRLALEACGGKCIFSSEINRHCRHIYYKNFGEFPYGDIKNIEASSIPKHDILCAGFPCQSFSIAGKKKGFKDPQGSLFYQIIRIAKYCQPKYLLLENVSNLISHERGSTFQQIQKLFNKIHYQIFWQILNSSHYGIPQNRKRIYIVAIKKRADIEKFEFPEANFDNIYLKDILLPNKLCTHLMIQDPPFWTKNLNTIVPELKPIRVGFIKKARQGERIYHENGHAVTLSASGGGLGGKTGLYWIQAQVRKLHIDECKKLMGFPSHFVLNETSNQSYKQLGNSVVIPIIQQIVMNILEHHQQTRNPKNWKIGHFIEKFVQKLLFHKTIASKIWPFSSIQSVILQGQKNTKADLLIKLTDHRTIGISVKASQTDFNQIHRLTLSRFANCLKLSKKSIKVFQQSIDNYRIQNRKCFIEVQYQKYIQFELEKRLEYLLNLIFLNNENIQIFVIYDRIKQEFFFYHMPELLAIFKKSSLSFSKKGIIKIGDYLSLQRKGGDGHYTKLPKNHRNHPSNQLQFKMKVLSFTQQYPPFFHYKLSSKFNDNH